MKFNLCSEQKSSAPSMLFTSTSLWIGKEIFSLWLETTCGDHTKIRIHVLHPEHTLSDNYRPKRSFGQGNIFTSVCHSVHGGGCVWSRGGYLVPEGGCLVPGGVWSRGVSNFSGGGFLQISGGVPPNFRGGSSKFPGGSPNFRGGGGSNFSGGGKRLLQNTVNVRPVLILLECILV